MIRHGRLLFDQPIDLPDGTVVEVFPVGRGPRTS
jgi:hypothetical protein